MLAWAAISSLLLPAWRVVCREEKWPSELQEDGIASGSHTRRLEVISTHSDLLDAIDQWFADRQSAMDLYGHISTWNVSSVDDMSEVFGFGSPLNDDISAWNTAAVTSMQQMLLAASSFNQPIGSWNTANVVDMGSMFSSVSRFNQPLEAWNTAKVTSFVGLFEDAVAFNQAVGSWNTAMVTNMNKAFSGASVFNQPLDTWNTAQAVNMRRLLYTCVEFNQPLASWDTARVTILEDTFTAAIDFNQPMGTWNTAKVQTMNGLFSTAVKFNQPINTWNTLMVSDMGLAFFKASSFQQSLHGWNTSNVIALDRLFSQASNFNGEMASWNTAKVLDITNTFGKAFAFNRPLVAWNVAKVSSMKLAFQWCSQFNQPLDMWNTATVSSMRSMFSHARAFNADIGSWNTVRVTDMVEMFTSANDFDQDLASWNVEAVVSFDDMFFHNALSDCNKVSILESWSSSNPEFFAQYGPTWGDLTCPTVEPTPTPTQVPTTMHTPLPPTPLPTTAASPSPPTMVPTPLPATPLPTTAPSSSSPTMVPTPLPATPLPTTAPSSSWPTMVPTPLPVTPLPTTAPSQPPIKFSPTLHPTLPQSTPTPVNTPPTATPPMPTPPATSSTLAPTAPTPAPTWLTPAPTVPTPSLPTPSPTAPTPIPTMQAPTLPAPTPFFSNGSATHGWKHVRHVPAGKRWHPAVDNMAGTEVYGAPSDDPQAAAWSIPFVDWAEVLFATGNRQHWLVATRDAVIGEYYANEKRDVVASSLKPYPHRVAWHNREALTEDPWVSLEDHAIGATFLYGEASISRYHTKTLSDNNGADVFIRTLPVPSGVPTWTPTHTPTGEPTLPPTPPTTRELVPSGMPTWRPTHTPSREPTLSPTPPTTLREEQILVIVDGMNATEDPSQSLANVSDLAKQISNASTAVVQALLGVVDVAQRRVLQDATPQVIEDLAVALESVTDLAVPQSPGPNQPPPPVPVDLAGQLADVVFSVANGADMSGTGLEVQSANKLVGSVAVLLGSVQATSGTVPTPSPGADQSSAPDPNNVDSSKQALSLVLRRTVDAVSGAVLVATPVGETVSMEAKGLALTVAHQDSNEIVQTGANVAGFRFPPLPPEVLSTQRGSIGFQHVSWPKNPYGYAGDSSETESGNSTFAGLDCCSVVHSSVQSMELRSGGQPVAVENLSTPIRFTLELEPRGATDPASNDSQRVYLCQYFDEGRDVWTDRGCRAISAHDTVVVCECNHLTAFASAFARLTDAAADFTDEAAIQFQHMLDCTTADVLSEESAQTIARGTWWQRASSLCVFGITLFFVASLVASVQLELRNRRKWNWSDHRLLVGQGSGGRVHTSQGSAHSDGAFTICRCLCCLCNGELPGSCCCKRRQGAEQTDGTGTDSTFMDEDAVDEEAPEKEVSMRRAQSTRRSFADRLVLKIAQRAVGMYAQGKIGVTLGTMRHVARHAKILEADREEEASKSTSKDVPVVLQLKHNFARNFEKDEGALSNVSIVQLVKFFFLVLQPLVTIGHFCVQSTATMRLLLFTLRFYGGLMAAALFYSAHPAADSKCTNLTFNDRVWQSIYVGIFSSLISVLPPFLLSHLVARNFTVVDRAGRSTRVLYDVHESINFRWRIKLGVIWSLALSCLGFCFYFIVVFLATADSQGAQSWLISSLVMLLKQQLVSPLALAVLLGIGVKLHLLGRPTHMREAWRKSFGIDHLKSASMDFNADKVTLAQYGSGEESYLGAPAEKTSDLSSGTQNKVATGCYRSVAVTHPELCESGPTNASTAAGTLCVGNPSIPASTRAADGREKPPWADRVPGERELPPDEPPGEPMGIPASKFPEMSWCQSHCSL